MGICFAVVMVVKEDVENTDGNLSKCRDLRENLYICENVNSEDMCVAST